MIIIPQQAWLQLPVRGDPEPVAEGTELGVVERADNLHFRTVKAVLLPVVHASRDNLV